MNRIKKLTWLWKCENDLCSGYLFITSVCFMLTLWFVGGVVFCWVLGFLDGSLLFKGVFYTCELVSAIPLYLLSVHVPTVGSKVHLNCIMVILLKEKIKLPFVFSFTGKCSASWNPCHMDSFCVLLSAFSFFQRLDRRQAGYCTSNSKHEVYS